MAADEIDIEAEYCRLTTKHQVVACFTHRDEQQFVDVIYSMCDTHYGVMAMPLYWYDDGTVTVLSRSKDLTPGELVELGKINDDYRDWRAASNDDLEGMDVGVDDGVDDD